ncbi:hypothetical protein EDB84DRAFT_1433608 [Lactarius hengduanensis]|nr:hypothetical protein EDB84DRAFT_1433608 [Lactarius hengduanensis]
MELKVFQRRRWRGDKCYKLESGGTLSLRQEPIQRWRNNHQCCSPGFDQVRLMECIVNKGINCLTIHCCTRNMPPCDRALVHHLKGVVDFVKGLGRDVAVIENDDCMSPVNERQLPGLPLWDIWDICSLYWMHDMHPRVQYVTHFGIINIEVKIFEVARTSEASTGSADDDIKEWEPRGLRGRLRVIEQSLTAWLVTRDKTRELEPVGVALLTRWARHVTSGMYRGRIWSGHDERIRVLGRERMEMKGSDRNVPCYRTMGHEYEYC